MIIGAKITTTGVLFRKAEIKATEGKIRNCALNTVVFPCCYDCVFSNSKSPIGTQAVVVTDNAVCALTQEEKADKTLFETSLRDFLKNEKLAANVTLYTDEKTFLNRVRGLAANFDDTDKRSMDRMEWITHAMKNMCL